MPDKPENLSDHDLLIAMNTKLDVALGSIQDHETRIRRMERWFWVAAGMAAATGATGATIVQTVIGG